MESSKVALIEVKLNSKWFKTCRCSRLFKSSVSVIELYDKCQHAKTSSKIYSSHNANNNQNVGVTVVTPSNIYNSFVNFFIFAD